MRHRCDCRCCGNAPSVPANVAQFKRADMVLVRVVALQYIHCVAERRRITFGTGQSELQAPTDSGEGTSDEAKYWSFITFLPAYVTFGNFVRPRLRSLFYVDHVGPMT
jgi:hypothetical protein